jgi:hypothetical protein
MDRYDRFRRLGTFIDEQSQVLSLKSPESP